MSLSTAKPPLVLASGSPRRKKLLEEAGYRFQVIPPGDVESCGLCSGETPAELVARLALRKALDVAPSVASGLLLACDTVAECEGQVLGKPRDEAHARAMLEQLAGKRHRVYSGVCLVDLPHGEPDVRVACTVLRMDPLTRGQIEQYLATDQWIEKAGAFGYQDRLGWVHVIEGSESNVVGLPMELVEQMIADAMARRRSSQGDRSSEESSDS